MSGLSYDRVRRLLESNGVNFHRTGKPRGPPDRAEPTRIVYLSELERAMPELMASIRFRDQEE